jgi:hypothetical protein
MIHASFELSLVLLATSMATWISGCELHLFSSSQVKLVDEEKKHA